MGLCWPRPLRSRLPQPGGARSAQGVLSSGATAGSPGRQALGTRRPQFDLPVISVVVPGVLGWPSRQQSLMPQISAWRHAVRTVMAPGRGVAACGAADVSATVNILTAQACVAGVLPVVNGGLGGFGDHYSLVCGGHDTHG